ncbi:MAG: formylglycine-generating enzyme family protein [Sedimentisphaerales bacterium]|nr:formylglycine-generating enzyme family protein [Sedimentisphaerales bacterium]
MSRFTVAYAWFRGNTYDKDEKYPHSVGQKQPNDFGLCDMYGNVWEWCGDWYDEGYYSKSQPIDPQGPRTGIYRVLRGGAWYDYANDCRSSKRYWSAPVHRVGNVGFRVVLGDARE